MKLTELVVEYLDSLDVSDASARTYSYTIWYFVDFVGDIDVNDLKPSMTDDYNDYLEEEKELQPSTRRGYFWPVRGVVKLGFERGYINIEPRKFKAPPAPRKRGPIMHVCDFQRMLHTALSLAESGDWRHVRNLAMFAFTGDTWCRRGGLMSLTFNRLDLDAWSAVLHEKDDMEHSVQYGIHTAEFLRRWMEVRPEPQNEHGSMWVTQFRGDVRPMNPHSWWDVLRKLAECAGVTGPHNPHSIRHMSATEASKRGVQVEVIQEKCGHKSSVTTIDIYLHADEERLRAATEDIGNILFGGV